MARYARWEKPVQDEDGNLLNGVWCKVRAEDVGLPLVPLFSDRAGAVPLSNPFFTASGPVAFHVAGGAYQIELYTGTGYSETFNFQAVGRGAETDIEGLNPMGPYSAGTTYQIADMVSVIDGGGDMLLFASKVDDNIGNTPDSATPADTAYWMLLPNPVNFTTTDVLTALGVGTITISTSTPSGGVNNDLWLQVPE